MRKPANLVYGLDESPPLHVTALNGAQYVSLIAITFVYPLLVFRAAGTPAQLVGDLLAVGLLVLGVGTFLQAYRIGPCGSGYMCPATFTATYLGPSLVAAQVGGLPLVFGMTAFAGLLEIAVAPLLNRLRHIFAPEISGLVIFVIGLSGGLAGLRAMLGEQAAPVSGVEWGVAAFTLAVMISLNVWAKGMAGMLCSLIGLVLGYVAAAASGLVPAQDARVVAEAAWAGVPSLGHLAWSFDLSLVAPFALAALAAAMKAVGTLAVCQRMIDADWVRPEMRSITRGVIADGASTAVAGLAGSVGLNSSTPSVGLAAATGMASRRVAYAAGILFVLAGLFPKLAALLAVIPRPVVVAALLFSVTFIMINGLQVMSARMLDSRRTLVIGLALVGGMAVEVFPALAADAPPWTRTLVGSSLVFSTLIALLLNLVFRIGIKKTSILSVQAASLDLDAVDRYMQLNGAAWGAERGVIERAKFGLMQSLELVAGSCEPEGLIEVAATFDEFNVDIRLSYRGPAPELPHERPSQDDILHSEDGHLKLAGFMLHRFADRVSAMHGNGRTTLLLHFDH